MQTKSVKTKVKIGNTMGLHARPAALLVEKASKFRAEITIIKGDIEVNAKSIMGILMLAAGKGTSLTIVATGPDCDEAVQTLAQLIKDGFYEI